jgi:hypothetical protein
MPAEIERYLRVFGAEGHQAQAVAI